MHTLQAQTVTLSLFVTTGLFSSNQTILDSARLDYSVSSKIPSYLYPVQSNHPSFPQNNSMADRETHTSTWIPTSTCQNNIDKYRLNHRQPVNQISPPAPQYRRQKTSSHSSPSARTRITSAPTGTFTCQTPSTNPQNFQKPTNNPHPRFSKHLPHTSPSAHSTGQAPANHKSPLTDLACFVASGLRTGRERVQSIDAG